MISQRLPIIVTSRILKARIRVIILKHATKSGKLQIQVRWDFLEARKLMPFDTILQITRRQASVQSLV